MKIIASFAAIGAFTASAAAAAAAPAAFTPTGKWTLDYAESMCVLQRAYGTRERPLVLGFKPAPMSDSLRLVVVSEELGNAGEFGTAKVGLGQGEPAEGRFFSVRARGKLVTVIDLERSALGPLDAATSLTIKAAKAVDATFALDNMQVAMKGLDHCMNDLLKSWGMEEAVLASIVTPPAAIGSMASYFRDTDYPDEAIRMNAQGSSGVRFMVGTDGRARDCKAVEPSGSEILDETTCDIVADRARFTPAMDRDGKPVASLSYTRITWRMPDD